MTAQYRLVPTEPTEERSIQCWPNGRPDECDATIPDSDYETMKAHGWGFVLAFDPAMPDGVPSSYYACPEHKDRYA